MLFPVNATVSNSNFTIHLNLSSSGESEHLLLNPHTFVWIKKLAQDCSIALEKVHYIHQTILNFPQIYQVYPFGQPPHMGGGGNGDEPPNKKLKLNPDKESNETAEVQGEKEVEKKEEEIEKKSLVTRISNFGSIVLKFLSSFNSKSTLPPSSAEFDQFHEKSVMDGHNAFNYKPIGNSFLSPNRFLEDCRQRAIAEIQDDISLLEEKRTSLKEKSRKLFQLEGECKLSDEDLKKLKAMEDEELEIDALIEELKVKLAEFNQKEENTSFLSYLNFQYKEKILLLESQQIELEGRIINFKLAIQRLKQELNSILESRSKSSEIDTEQHLVVLLDDIEALEGQKIKAQGELKTIIESLEKLNKQLEDLEHQSQSYGMQNQFIGEFDPFSEGESELSMSVPTHPIISLMDNIDAFAESLISSDLDPDVLLDVAQYAIINDNINAFTAVLNLANLVNQLNSDQLECFVEYIVLNQKYEFLTLLLEHAINDPHQLNLIKIFIIEQLIQENLMDLLSKYLAEFQSDLTEPLLISFLKKALSNNNFDFFHLIIDKFSDLNFTSQQILEFINIAIDLKNFQLLEVIYHFFISKIHSSEEQYHTNAEILFLITQHFKVSQLNPVYFVGSEYNPSSTLQTILLSIANGNNGLVVDFFNSDDVEESLSEIMLIAILDQALRYKNYELINHICLKFRKNPRLVTESLKLFLLTRLREVGKRIFHEYLVLLDVNIEKFYPIEVNAVQIAALGNHTDVIEAFLQIHPEYFYSGDGLGFLPIILAAQNGFWDLVLKIIEQAKLQNNPNLLMGENGLNQNIRDLAEKDERQDVLEALKEANFQ